MQYYDLRRYQLRNGYASRPSAPGPARPVRPPSAKVFGAFNPIIGESAPFLLTLQALATFAEAEQAQGLDLDYVGCERTLLRSWAVMPDLKVPPPSPSGHIFELRSYRSNSAATLQKKLDMLVNGELAIFLRLGFTPVFFGEALLGDNLPHLSYMLCYDDLAARDRQWKAFAADPAWQKLRSTPGLTDADLVSNITNTVLRPTDISDIR
jgi:hypothetical protein